jgi:hypothetical protein
MPLEHDPEASPAPDSIEGQVSNPADVSAESSTASPDANAPKLSLLDVVKAAVAPKGDEGSEESSTSQPDPKTEAAAPAEAEAPKDLTPEEISKLPFGRHPRFKQVLEERNSFKTKLGEAEQRYEQSRGPAEQYAKIEEFRTANNLATEEVVQLFQVGALIKNNPEQALIALGPVLDDLLTRTGRKLPDDLKKDIDSGYITEERAQELSRTRAREAEASARAEAATTRATTVEQTTAASTRAAAFNTAILDWEAGKKASDPDFAVKEQMIADRTRAIAMAEGAPKTPQEAVALADRAHREITAHLGRVRPAPRQVNPGPGSRPTPAITPQPKSMLDAVKYALAKGSNG